MSGKNLLAVFAFFSFIFSYSGCKSKPDKSIPIAVFDSIPQTDTNELTTDLSHSVKHKPLTDTIVGDTIWLKSITSSVYFDSLHSEGFSVFISVRIDTSDLIIDTVASTKGSRIVIGFNHLYRLEFTKDEKNWFTLEFSKKNELAQVLDGTDLWMESNLNVIENIIFNERFEKIVVELNIQSPSSFALPFYMIVSPASGIEHIGSANSWGGESPDAVPFITENGELYITASEVYNFRKAGAMTLSQYVSMSVFRSTKTDVSELVQVHAIRNLTNNYFLVVFSRFHDEPVQNAFVLSADTTLISQFSYYGIVEEMDAILLYAEDSKFSRSFLYDISRDKLICIAHINIPKIYELGIEEMLQYNSDSSSAFEYKPLDFNMYGSFTFYTTGKDTSVYYNAGQFR